MKKGALQEKIRLIVQEKGPISAPDVCALLREDREISLNTVQTVLNRLLEQGLLIRTGIRRQYLYQVSDEIVRQHAAHAALDLLSQSDELGLAYFVEAIDKVRPEAIETLERLLQERRAKGNKS